MAAGIRASFYDPAALDLPHVLVEVYGDDENFHQRCGSIALHQYGQPNDEDIDSGPYHMWRTENAGLSVTDSFLLNDDWLRDCAYVFWDSDRVQKMGMFRKRAYTTEEMGGLDGDCI